MSLIIALGTNIEPKLEHLKNAIKEIEKFLEIESFSSVYLSEAQDYTNQDDFFNMLIQCKLPHKISPEEVMQSLLEIEKKSGRIRTIDKGPRTIDLDIIFWDQKFINTPSLIVPHPRWNERSFVVRPLQELPFFQTIKKCFTIPSSFKIEAKIVDKIPRN